MVWSYALLINVRKEFPWTLQQLLQQLTQRLSLVPFQRLQRLKYYPTLHAGALTKSSAGFVKTHGPSGPFLLREYKNGNHDIDCNFRSRYCWCGDSGV